MIMPSTVRLHRVLTTSPEKVYRAFLEADALAKWLPPNGFTCTVHHFEPKVRGTFKMSFRNFTTGNSHAFGGEYLEIVPNERLVVDHGSDVDNDPHRFRVTITFDEQSDKKTVVTMRQLHPTKEQRDAGIAFGAVEIGYTTMDKLAEHLRRMQ